MRLRREGASWTLYSVGPDGEDGGGKPRKEAQGQGYDLVVSSARG